MITLEDVSFRYNGGREKDGLRGVDLAVPDGQVVLLCGESGSGKSTLTRLVNGLVPHFYEGDLTGRVTVDGIDVNSAELSDLTPHVGSVFQNPRSQFFTVDTDSELVFASENLGWDPQEILRRRDAVVQDFGIGDLRRRNLFHLSGGQKQQIAATCQDLAARGRTVVVVTHDPELVLAGCDHVLRPDGGSVVESYPLDAHGRARVLDFFEEARA